MSNYTMISDGVQNVLPAISWLKSWSNIATLFAFFVGSYVFRVIVYGLFLCPTRHIPGPFITRFTNLKHVYLLLSGSQAFEIHTQHEKYGPIVRLGPDKVDAQLPEIAYQGWGGKNENKTVWDKDPMMSPGGRFGFSMDNLFSMSNSGESLRIRRLVGPPYAKKFLLDQEWIFKDCTKKLIKRLNQLRETNGNKADVLVEYKKYALDAVIEFSFGGMFKVSDIRPGGDAIELLDQVPYATGFSVFVPNLYKIFKLLPFKMFSWVHAKDDYTKEYLENKYKQSVKPGSRKDSLGHLISARDEDRQTGLSDEELMSNTAFFLVGGVDTTGTALTYITYVLATHPELFPELVKEITPYKDIDSLKLVELEQLNLLNAVIYETLRLWPPAPSTVPRVVPENGVEIGGYHLPAGVLVYRSPWTAGRDPELFPYPDEFKPERWLAMSRADQHKILGICQVFSYGPRICLGKEMALMELRMAMAAMIMNYIWEGVPDEAGHWDEEMSPIDRLIIQPRKGKCVVNLKDRV